MLIGCLLSLRFEAKKIDLLLLLEQGCNGEIVCLQLLAALWKSFDGVLLIKFLQVGCHCFSTARKDG